MAERSLIPDHIIDIELLEFNEDPSVLLLKG